MKWAYGVTTVPSRLENPLPKTLKSLSAGGFERPWLFVDGDRDRGQYNQFTVEGVTFHHPPLRAYGNWIVALWILYVRNPDADRWAIFQDDLVTYRNLRQYLERCPYPEPDGPWAGANPYGPLMDGNRPAPKGYLNLYTFPSNQELVPKGKGGKEQPGWYLSNQKGRGAVALVFSRQAVLALLASQHMVERPLDVHMGHRSIDGGVVTAMEKAGWKEYVHYPSLVQHTGELSTVGPRHHPQAPSFKGESYDAMKIMDDLCS